VAAILYPLLVQAARGSAGGGGALKCSVLPRLAVGRHGSEPAGGDGGAGAAEAREAAAGRA
jgi:hypothetical protein